MLTLAYAAIVLSVIFKDIKGFKVKRQDLEEHFRNDKLQTLSQDAWSSELIKRLNAHSCKPGAIHQNTTLLHGLKAGTFKELGRVKDVEVCVLQCCESHHCELALFQDNYCYGITCYSQQHCKTVPALESNHKLVTVFLYKTSRANVTSNTDQEINQSKPGESTKKNSPKFVFYPVDTDDTKDLAFSVNLRKIASHYTDDEMMRQILTEKADEHLTGKYSVKNKSLAKGEENDNEKRNKSMTLDQFFSRDKVSSTAHNGQPVSNDKRRKIVTHKKNDNVSNIDWSSKLLKAAISSSSVALLIVVLVLLAMTRKKTKGQQ